MERLNGGCLCGAVRFSAIPENTEIDACHCGMCQRMAGGPVLAVKCGKTLELADGAPVSFYQSSEWAERGFCQQCGSSMFWRMRDGSMSFVHAGAFDALPSEMSLDVEIFIEDKPPYYAFAGERKRMTGEEVAAMFGDTPS